MTPTTKPQVPPAAFAFCAPSARPYLLVAAILASALGFIDGTVVAIAIPAMRSSLGASLAEAQWVHNAYMLTLSSLILVGGAFGDRFGLARVFAAGIAVFVAASLLCAIAPSPLFLVLARAAQGIGAAVMVPGSLAVIARAYPRDMRGAAIGRWAAASALTTALGPIIGGLALTFGGPEMWRWVFAINLPLGGLALWLLLRHVEPDRGQAGTEVDFAGAALATAGLFALAWGLTTTHGAVDGPDLRWIGAGVLALLTFLWTETRVAAPMMPLSLFASRVFSAANLVSFCIYAALSILFFFLPMTLIAGWGMDEITTSLSFAPMSVFIASLSSRMGRLADRVGPALLLALGAVIVAAGYAGVALSAPAQEFWKGVLPAMCLVGLGMSLIVAPLSSAVMGAVDETQSGVASGINNAVTRMAGLISVAAVGGIAASAYAAASGPAFFGAELADPAHASAMSAGLRTLSWLAAALALISVLPALCIRARKPA